MQSIPGQLIIKEIYKHFVCQFTKQDSRNKKRMAKHPGNKYDRDMTCMFCLDLSLNITLFCSVTKRSF